MVQVYRNRWKGVRMLAVQALDWPRGYVYLEPVITGANMEYPNLVANNIVPIDVQRACAELALKASAGELLADTTQQAIRKKVEGIEIEYDKYSPQNKQYQAIDALLHPYMLNSGAISQTVGRA
jgi:hypothetical protein